VRFMILTAASMKMAVFGIVALCSLVEVYRRFRGACCLLHQGHHPDYTCNNLEDSRVQVVINFAVSREW
jgi:hypothetical protein